MTNSILFHVAWLLGLGVSCAVAQNVTTYHYDNYVSGVNAHETVLKPANVNVSTFGQLFNDPMEGQAYAQPLYLAGVNIPGRGTHNVVYVATCQDIVYAFDADAGGDPLWKTSFVAPGSGITTVPQPEVISGDIVPEIGIVGTPVIDAVSGTLYVVAKTRETGRGDNHIHYVQKLHALDVATGAEKFGGPKVLGDTTCDHAGDHNANQYDYNFAANPQTPNVRGSGNAAVDGTIYFNALRANQRPSLALYRGVVYIGWSSHGDNPPYNGWFIGYDPKTLLPLPNRIFCTTPNGSEGGFWQAGSGPAIDQAGNLFLSTGNGDFDGNKGGRNWSQTFLKFLTANGLSTDSLAPGPAQTFDYFTVHNEKSLSDSDTDMGAGGMTLFDDPDGPVPHLAIGSGKEGYYYLMDRDAPMGRFDPRTDHVVQRFEKPSGREIMTTPVFYNNTLFYNRNGEDLRARLFAHGQFVDGYTHSLKSFNPRGGGPIVSSNGVTDGIVWIIDNGGPASLCAYSADAMATAPAGTAVHTIYEGRMPDGGVKFTQPVVINGKVYTVCATHQGNTISSAHLCAFGLLAGTGTARPTAPAHLTATSDSPETVTLAWTSHDPATSGFIVYRATEDNLNFTQIATTGGSETRYVDKTVTGATICQYYIVAVNRNGKSGNSNTVTIRSHDYLTENGLVAYWAFDEGDGNVTVDLTGHGHAGRLAGEVSWSQGIRSTSGLDFHGTGNAQSHVAVADKPDLDFGATQSFSIVAWVRPISYPGHWAGVVTKSRETPQGGYGIYISPQNEWTFRGAGDQHNVSGGMFLANSWQQIVAVQDGTAGTRTLYVNGAAVAGAPVAQAADGSGPLWIGQAHADEESFAGGIDDVRIYNRALSAGDVTGLLGNYLPKIKLLEPADNFTANAAADLMLKAEASAPAQDASVSEVRFYQGTTMLGKSNAAPYACIWKNVPAGDYVLTAHVSDSNGNTVMSAPVRVKVTAGQGK